MSRFCGKCDFYDCFCMIAGDGDETKIMANLPKLKLYVYGKDGRAHLIKTETIKDITKYYPYLEAVGCGEKDGSRVIYLASDSFIDQEEREHLGYYIKDVYKYYNKCKRTKTKFTADECVGVVGSWWTNTELIYKIADRVEKDGKKAEFDDLHLPMWEHYRRDWFEEMVRVGYSEVEAYNWCFKGLFDSEETTIKRLGRPLNYGNDTV